MYNGNGNQGGNRYKSKVNFQKTPNRVDESIDMNGKD